MADQIAALGTGAGMLVKPDVYTLVLQGADRVRFLNGMVTSDVSKLAPGQGQLAVKASPRGRVEGLLRIRCAADALYVEVTESSAQRVADALAKMIIMDDATLADGTPSRTVLGLYGPRSAAILRGLSLASPTNPHAFESTEFVTVINDDTFGIDGFELHVPPADADVWQEKLTTSGAVAVSPDALDVVRVERGRPRDGVDIDVDTIPMEARLEDALDFEKGCYVGQEVIARAHNLGGVKHILVGLTFEGAPPAAAGLALTADADGKATGEVTSVVVSPTYGSIGLGFVRTAHQSPGTVLRVHSESDATEVGRATVAALPFER